MWKRSYIIHTLQIHHFYGYSKFGTDSRKYKRRFSFSRIIQMWNYKTSAHTHTHTRAVKVTSTHRWCVFSVICHRFCQLTTVRHVSFHCLALTMPLSTRLKHGGTQFSNNKTILLCKNGAATKESSHRKRNERMGRRESEKESSRMREKTVHKIIIAHMHSNVCLLSRTPRQRNCSQFNTRKLERQIQKWNLRLFLRFSSFFCFSHSNGLCDKI